MRNIKETPQRDELVTERCADSDHASRITHHANDISQADGNLHALRITHHSPIRIARIIDRLNVGGPAKHTVWLTGGLDSDQFETALITGTVPPGEGDMGYFARAAGIEPVVIERMSRELSLFDLMVLVKLVRLLFKLKPHIVHTHKSKAGAVGRLAAFIYKWMTPSALWFRPRPCRIVHTYHGHIFHSYYGAAKTRLFINIERALAKITDRIITISRQQRREISEEFRVGRPAQFQVIPLGIDLDETARRGRSLREELGVGGDQILIGTVGRLCEVKNYEMLIRVAAQLAETDGETSARARFALIGDGHLREELQQLSRSLGINDKIAFTGFREDAPSLYADLDMVALTSLNEGTPLTLIEAMSCGRAVIATEVGGVADIMGAHLYSSDGFSIWEHGVTAPSQDIEAYTKALRFLINRPELRSEMGERGRAFARANMSRDRLIKDIEELYRELTGQAIPSPNRARSAVGYEAKGR